MGKSMPDIDLNVIFRIHDSDRVPGGQTHGLERSSLVSKLAVISKKKNKDMAKASSLDDENGNRVVLKDLKELRELPNSKSLKKPKLEPKEEKTDWDWVNTFVDEPSTGLENLAEIQKLEDSFETVERSNLIMDLADKSFIEGDESGLDDLDKSTLSLNDSFDDNPIEMLPRISYPSSK